MTPAAKTFAVNSNDVTVTEPLYVPALRPEGFTETLTLPGVVPLPVAISHVPPEGATV